MCYNSARPRPGKTAARHALARAAVVGLGANMEAPREMILAAAARLAATEGLDLLAVSSVYLTEPQGGPAGQPWYHNAAAFFASRLSPRRFMGRLMEVEMIMGRRRLEKDGPRVIDLDWLAQGELVLDEPPDIILPHPRLTGRLFALAPLAELAPGWRHPRLGLSAARLLAGLDPAGQGFKKLGPLF